MFGIMHFCVESPGIGTGMPPDHLPFLQSHLQTLHLDEERAKIPYLPLVRAPYYVFIGRKGEGTA